MRVKFTPSRVLTLPSVAGAGRTEYVDSECRGLVLRVMPTGIRFYFVRYRINGQARRYRLGEASAHGGIALDAARRAARGVLGDVAHGKDPQAVRIAERLAARQRRAEGTVAGLVEKFLEACERRPLAERPRPNTMRSWRGLLATRITDSPLGRRVPSAVAYHDVEALLDSIRERHATTANRTLELLRVAFAWAVKKRYVNASPCAGLKKSKEPKRERALSHDELRQVLVALDAEEAAHPIEGAAWRLLILTGLRDSEVREAPLLEVDVRARRWSIPAARMKGKRPHTVPLCAAAIDVVHALAPLRGSSPWLLPSLRDPARPLSTLAHSLKRLHAASKTEKWSAHDLRHTLRSELSAMGVPLEVKELILAHALPGLAGTYDHHSYLRERGAALERWSRLLDRIKAGEETESAEVATFTPRHSGGG
jgi:integrase